MKIVHISDTHVGHADNDQRLERIVDHICRIADPADSLVLHTGDLIDRSAPTESQRARAILRRLEQAGLRLILAPGNHDYGDASRIDARRAASFREDFADYLFAGQPREFPVEHRIGDCLFIGLDSSAAELGPISGLFAEGHLGSEQLTRLDAILQRVRQETPRPRIVVYLHHHPFIDGYVVRPDIGDSHFLNRMTTWYTRSFRRLKDACSFVEILRDRVDLLLFGHQHYGLNHRAEAERYGIGLALDASSSTCTAMYSQRMRFRIIDTDTLATEMHFVP